MELVVYETAPPFIIKIYNTYFSITWEGFEEKEEDCYKFELIKSIRIDKDPEQDVENTRLAASFLDRLFGNTPNYETASDVLLGSALDDLPGSKKSFRRARRQVDFSELIIERRDGNIEKRYLNKANPENLREALEMINSKLSNSKNNLVVT